MADAVDYDGLELIDMRLEIDVDTLLDYLRANSDFPDGPASVSCYDTLRAVLNCDLRIAELSILCVAAARRAGQAVQQGHV